MRLSLLLIIFALLFSCGVNSNKNGNRQTQTYSTKDGDFIVSIDTLNVKLKPYVSPDIKVSLTHAIKYGERYYCYFTDKNDSYNKYFFVISNNGLIEKEIQLPKDLTDCYYLDLFVLNDTIFSKPYMNDKNFFLDLNTLTWIETSEPDDVIYEDERFYVTYIDFGEWGSTTWFKDKLSGKEKNLRCVAVEPMACPSLTKGIYAFDYGDVAGMAPIAKMFTLGHNFMPPPVHAGGLRYHGMSPLISYLYDKKLIEAKAVFQIPTFAAGVQFARTEGILPAPESNHAIRVAIDEALACKESGESKVILLNLSGHGNFDLAAYDEYLSGKLADYEYPEDKIKEALKTLPKVEA